MAYGFAGSVTSFEKAIQQGDFASQLSSSRIATGGHKLSLAEQNIWNDIAGSIIDIFKSSDINSDKTYVFAEYDIPGHLGRCDLVIIGAGFNGQNNGLVIEMKKWSHIDALEDSGYVRLGGRLYIHPADQATGYRDKLIFFHEKSSHYNWGANVWFSNMDKGDLALLEERKSSGCALFSLANNTNQLDSYLKSLFGVGLSADYFIEFSKSGYHQNPLLALELNRRLPNLTKGIAHALGTPPHDLSQEQQSVVECIGNELKFEGNKLILISGEPGSGKTIVGITAMIEQLARNDQSRVVLALRNNRLCTVVRSAIDDAGLGVGGALVQYVKGGGPSVGIWYEVKAAQDNQTSLPIYDLIVIDEAHRIPHKNPRGNENTLSQLEAVLLAGKVVVCLFDEGQILNEDDNGTKEFFKQIWSKKFPNCKIIDLFLDEQHRLPIEYNEWLLNLFNGRKQASPANYDFKVVSSPRDVVAYLSTKKHEAECGLLASYTVSDGRNGNTLRITDPPIRWLMTKEEYNRWWRDKSVRHLFKHCSSVYGCQGFDLDYAGVFWGKDLTIRLDGDSVEFDLSRPNDITDNIGMAHGRKLVTLARLAETDEDIHNLVVSRLINRYRILLSRGRKGTILYCEDEKTSAALSSLQFST
jgi:hypothetical protein